MWTNNENFYRHYCWRAFELVQIDVDTSSAKSHWRFQECNWEDSSRWTGAAEASYLLAWKHPKCSLVEFCRCQCQGQTRSRIDHYKADACFSKELITEGGYSIILKGWCLIMWTGRNRHLGASFFYSRYVTLTGSMGRLSQFAIELEFPRLSCIIVVCGD